MSDRTAPTQEAPANTRRVSGNRTPIHLATEQGQDRERMTQALRLLDQAAREWEREEAQQITTTAAHVAA